MAGTRKGLHALTVQEAENASMGQAGSTLIVDAATYTGPFVAVTALEDIVVDVSTITNITNIMDSAVDFTVVAGITIYGRFDTFSIDSGKCIAYKG